MRVVVTVLVTNLLIAVVATYPLIRSIGTSVSDPVDAILNTWIVAYGHHALLTQPRELFHSNIFYPHPWTLLFSEALLLPVFLLLPIYALTGNALFSLNVLLLMGFTFTATSGFLLGRWLFHSFWPALVVGTIFAFNSYTLSNTGQVQLLHLEWLPLVLLYLGKALQKPSLRSAWLMAFFLAAQFYTSVYYGIFGFLVVVLVGSVVWMAYPYPAGKVRLQSAGAVSLGLIVAAALCRPLAWDYYTLSRPYGFQRTLHDTWPYAASLEMWLTVRPGHLLYGPWLDHELPKLGYYALDALSPGGLLLSLAAVGVLLALARTSLLRRSPGHRARRAVAGWPYLLLLGIGFFWLLSLGPYLQVRSLQPNFEITLPYAWVHTWVPGFTGLRAPVRLAAVVYLGIAIAAAYGLRHVRWPPAHIGLFALLLGEQLAVPASTLHTPQTSMEQQAVYRWLAAQPPTVYLELPIYPFGEGDAARWLESQYHSIRHWQATPAGYSGYFPPRHAELLDFLNQFPRAEVVELLQAMGVEWVIVHRARLTDAARLATDAAIDTHRWRVQTWGDIWAVHLPPNPMPRPAARFVLPAVAQAGGTVTIGRILRGAEPHPIVPGSELGRVRVEWRQAGVVVLAAERQTQPPYYVDALAVAGFTMPVPAQAGSYTLHVFAGAPAQEVAAGVVEVIVDRAPPEVTLLPVRPVAATLQCAGAGDEIAIDVWMQTIGWYDQPFTLSGRLVDDQAGEVARSRRDVEFRPERARRDLLSLQPYTLPFAARHAIAAAVDLNHPPALELVAYQWQQAAERVVARHFVDDAGNVVPSITLPLTVDPACVVEHAGARDTHIPAW